MDLQIKKSSTIHPRQVAVMEFRIHYMDSSHCLLLLLSIFRLLLFSFFLFLHFFVVGSVRQIKLTHINFRLHVEIAYRIVSYSRRHSSCNVAGFVFSVAQRRLGRRIETARRRSGNRYDTGRDGYADSSAGFSETSPAGRVEYRHQGQTDSQLLLTFHLQPHKPV